MDQANSATVAVESRFPLQIQGERFVPGPGRCAPRPRARPPLWTGASTTDLGAPARVPPGARPLPFRQPETYVYPLRRFAALLLPALLAGCELTEVTIEPGEEVVAVEAVLRTDTDIQGIILHSSLDGRDVRGVTGAHVTVTGNGRTFVFEEEGTDCYHFSATYFRERPGSVNATCYQSLREDGFWLTAGQEYRLRVDLPDGRVIQGRTRVPGTFALTGLPFVRTQRMRGVAECAVPPGTLQRLSWSRADSAWSYIAPIRIFGIRAALARDSVVAEIPDPLELVGLAISEEDTDIILPSEFGVFDRFQYDSEALAALQQGFPEGVLVELMVAAADRNYVNAVRGGRFNPSGPVRISSVAGDGVGVFGSLVPLYVRMRVLRRETARLFGIPICPIAG
ncbi:MAG: hypothetical protein AVDCRST_MAG68-1029 [uncultured Gemmatimonadetes bacterium]|uniref:DUF4249 family protein n=1 Tax=uncultured Gemmatimonadota bacterium TaxID=203437 RepID=A0A6J4KK49_9BACT|nr:MAG: hypothetical protein AVDCRST_MAG68-1029 [uncultured Gemmatimonadota bacterium]